MRKITEYITYFGYMKDSLAGILDLPNKTLPPDIWDHKPGQLPRLRPAFRKKILSYLDRTLKKKKLPRMVASHIYGGAASYQWHEGSDIDVSIFIDWNSKLEKDYLELMEFFKSLELPYKDFVVHFYLKSPTEPVREVAESYYDIINNHWVLEPLELPKGYDPEQIFKPFLDSALIQAKEYDLALGALKREVAEFRILEKQFPELADKKLARSKMLRRRENIRKLLTHLVQEYLQVRERRNKLHEALRDRPKLERKDRFEAAEIIWKYLDRYGYTGLFAKFKKYLEQSRLEADFDLP